MLLAGTNNMPAELEKDKVCCVVIKGELFTGMIKEFTTSPNQTYQMKLYREAASLNFRYEKVLPVTTGLVHEYLDEFEYTYIT